MSKDMGFLDYLCLLLVVIGGLNWGSVGIFEFNFVKYLFNNVLAGATWVFVERAVYVIVGLATGYVLAVTARKY